MSDLDVHLAGIAEREESSFAAWLAGAEPAVRRGLRRFAASVDVEAVVQETLLRIWQLASRHQPDGRPDSLLRLAHRIARNLAIDEARRMNRQQPLDDDAEERPEELQAQEPAPDPLLARLLQRCLSRLPAKPSLAIHQRLLASGERDEELAVLAGMAVNTFRQNLVRARRALVECLARNGVQLDEVWR